jgi:hypothetical protein
MALNDSHIVHTPGSLRSRQRGHCRSGGAGSCGDWRQTENSTRIRVAKIRCFGSNDNLSSSDGSKRDFLHRRPAGAIAARYPGFEPATRDYRCALPGLRGDCGLSHQTGRSRGSNGSAFLQ